MEKVIDISGHQNYELDYDSLKEFGVTGIIVKISEGQSRFEPTFINQINSAIDHGFKVGIYHFSHASNISEADQEMDFLISLIQEYLNGQTPELGIWIDVESDSMTSESYDITDTVLHMIYRLNELGLFAGIYSYYSWLSKESESRINIDIIPSYIPLWVAQYSSKNDLLLENPNLNIELWQYTDRALIGNNSYLDVSIKYK